MLHTLLNVILSTTLSNRCYYYLHIRVQETEAQSRNCLGETQLLSLGRGRGKGGGGRWYPGKLHGGACAFVESCEMSRGLSHGEHCQAREQDVHKHGGVRKQGMFRNYKYFSIAADHAPGAGWLASG